MDMFDTSNPTFWISCLAGAAILGIGSYIFQKRSGDVEQNIILRDSILGVIFTLMAWVSVPDTMKEITSSMLSESVADATQAVAKKAVHFQDLELHVGPPGF